VPVATIKFYLREELLHEGRLTSPTQAQYDETHVRRLALIRALLGPGGLSVAATRELLKHIDHPPESRHALLGIAHQALQQPAAADVDLTAVHALMRRWGWRVEDKDCDSQAALARALQGLEAADFDLPVGALDRYAQMMSEVAESEVAEVPTGSTEEAVRYVVLGTVLIEPLLLALRRMAQQDASGRRFSQPEQAESTSSSAQRGCALGPDTANAAEGRQ
jgi:DNA-binding transcriptional MerR regulator